LNKRRPKNKKRKKKAKTEQAKSGGKIKRKERKRIETKFLRRMENKSIPKGKGEIGGVGNRAYSGRRKVKRKGRRPSVIYTRTGRKYGTPHM